MSKEYLGTDTQQDALESLETAVEYSTRVLDEPAKWKWLVIALHSCVQGLMVLSLEKGNGLQVLVPRYRARALKALEEGALFPPEKMNYFLDLYGDVKTSVCEGYVDARRFVAEQRHDDAMERLNVTRNDWIHFTPKGWSIEFRFLSEMARDVTEIIGFLALESSAFIWGEEAYCSRAEEMISSLKTNIRSLEAEYERLATAN